VIKVLAGGSIRNLEAGGEARPLSRVLSDSAGRRSNARRPGLTSALPRPSCRGPGRLPQAHWARRGTSTRFLRRWPLTSTGSTRGKAGAYRTRRRPRLLASAVERHRSDGDTPSRSIPGRTASSQSRSSRWSETLEGTLLDRRRVRHVYAFREGLIARMDVEDQPERPGVQPAPGRGWCASCERGRAAPARRPPEFPQHSVGRCCSLAGPESTTPADLRANLSGVRIWCAAQLAYFQALSVASVENERPACAGLSWS